MYFFIFNIIFFNCISYHNVNNKPPICVKLIYNLPLVIEPLGELMNIKDSVHIFYYKDYTVCITNVKQYVKVNRDSIQENASPSYLIFLNNSTNGYMFYNINDTSYEIENVDTFFQNRYFKKRSLSANENDSLVERKFEKGGEFLVKKFLTKKRYDETYPDSSIYYFKKSFANINYSLSDKMDTVSDMKLSKIRYVYKKESSKNYSFVIPAREILFELQEVVLPNEKEIINFIEQFAKKQTTQ